MLKLLHTHSVPMSLIRWQRVGFLVLTASYSLLQLIGYWTRFCLWRISNRVERVRGWLIGILADTFASTASKFCCHYCIWLIMILTPLLYLVTIQSDFKPQLICAFPDVRCFPEIFRCLDLITFGRVLDAWMVHRRMHTRNWSHAKLSDLVCPLVLIHQHCIGASDHDCLVMMVMLHRAPTSMSLVSSCRFATCILQKGNFLRLAYSS